MTSRKATSKADLSEVADRLPSGQPGREPLPAADDARVLSEPPAPTAIKATRTGGLAGWRANWRQGQR